MGKSKISLYSVTIRFYQEALKIRNFLHSSKIHSKIELIIKTNWQKLQKNFASRFSSLTLKTLSKQYKKFKTIFQEYKNRIKKYSC